MYKSHFTNASYILYVVILIFCVQFCAYSSGNKPPRKKSSSCSDLQAYFIVNADEALPKSQKAKPHVCRQVLKNGWCPAFTVIVLLGSGLFAAHLKQSGLQAAGDLVDRVEGYANQVSDDIIRVEKGIKVVETACQASLMAVTLELIEANNAVALAKQQEAFAQKLCNDTVSSSVTHKKSARVASLFHKNDVPYKKKPRERSLFDKRKHGRH